MKLNGEQVTSNLPINKIISEHQEEYQPIPANISPNSQIAFTFDLTDEEVQEIVNNKKIYVSLLTYGRSMNPIRLSTSEEDFEEGYNYNEEMMNLQKEKTKGNS